MAIRVKRVYDEPSANDGLRILVDRLWPRGLTKAKARIDFWAKSISPSNELRRWYSHEPDKWEEFRVRYIRELEENLMAAGELREKIGDQTVTFLYSSKEERLNNAVALKEYFERNQGQFFQP